MLAITSMESKKRRSGMFLLDGCLLLDFLSLSILPMIYRVMSHASFNLIGLGLSDLSPRRVITGLGEFDEKKPNFSGVILLGRVWKSFQRVSNVPTFPRMLKLTQI